jgi:hypothetical protein
MKTTLSILSAFLTLSSVTPCLASFLPEVIDISAANSAGHGIKVEMAFVTDGTGKPVRLGSRVVTVSVPTTKSDRSLTAMRLRFNSPNVELSAPLAFVKIKNIAKVSFTIDITHLKTATVSASYSGEPNKTNTLYLIPLESFIPNDNEPQKDKQNKAEMATPRKPSD